MEAPRVRSDHYAVLGVAPSATGRQITSAYRALVRVLHPDSRPAEPHSAERLVEVVAAYQVLGDADRRAAYDALQRRARDPDPPVGRDWTGAGHLPVRGVPVRVHHTGDPPVAAGASGRSAKSGWNGPWPPGAAIQVGPVRRAAGNADDRSTSPTCGRSVDLADLLLRHLWGIDRWL